MCIRLNASAAERRMPAGISHGICESAASPLSPSNARKNDGVASASPRHFSFLTLRPRTLTHVSPCRYGLLSRLIRIRFSKSVSGCNVKKKEEEEEEEKSNNARIRARIGAKARGIVTQKLPACYSTGIVRSRRVVAVKADEQRR